MGRRRRHQPPPWQPARAGWASASSTKAAATSPPWRLMALGGRSEATRPGRATAGTACSATLFCYGSNTVNESSSNTAAL